MAVTENLRKGMRAVRDGRKGEARDLFRSVLDEDPINETALLWLGYLADDPHVSLNRITQALESHPRSPRVFAALLWAWRSVAALRPELESDEPKDLGRTELFHRPWGGRRWVAGLPLLSALLLLVIVV